MHRAQGSSLISILGSQASLWVDCFCAHPPPPPVLTLIHMNVIKPLQPEQDTILMWLVYSAPVIIKWGPTISTVSHLRCRLNYDRDCEFHCLGTDWELWHQFDVANGKYYLHQTFSCLHSAMQKETATWVPKDADLKWKLWVGVGASQRRITCQGRQEWKMIIWAKFSLSLSPILEIKYAITQAYTTHQSLWAMPNYKQTRNPGATTPGSFMPHPLILPCPGSDHERLKWHFRVRQGDSPSRKSGWKSSNSQKSGDLWKHP